MGAVKVSKLRKRAEAAQAATPIAVRNRLLAVLTARIDRAGSILAEVSDHVRSGEVSLAEIGALTEVNAAVSEAAGVCAFVLRVDSGEEDTSSLILPPEKEIVLPG